MTKSTKAISIATALCLGIGGAAYAQALNKWVMPDGRIVYSDRPVAGGTEVREVAPPPPVDPAARSQAEEAARRDAKAVEGVNERIDERRAQRKTVQEAQADLNAAKRKLEEGKESLPGERTGTAGGGSRLNEVYWKRQEANKLAVEQAENALREARAGG